MSVTIADFVLKDLRERGVFSFTAAHNVVMHGWGTVEFEYDFCHEHSDAFYDAMEKAG